MKGQVFSIEQAKVTIISEDHDSELNFDLRSMQEFTRVESSDEPQYGTGLICFFASHSFVGLTELKEL
jgi:hypothetical protein